jgi:hypothetical protein
MENESDTDIVGKTWTSYKTNGSKVWILDHFKHSLEVGIVD